MGTIYPEECGATSLKGTSRYPFTYDPPFIHPPRFAEGKSSRRKTFVTDRNATSIGDAWEHHQHG